MPSPYPHSFRVQMVRRMVGPDSVTATDISREPNSPSQSVLSQWLREARALGISQYFQGFPVTSPSPSSQEQLAILLQAAALSGEQLGAFLRQRGLTQDTLALWQRQLSDSLAQPKHRPESRAQRLKVKKLEKEIARKDKALAEAAALLLLQKKVQQIWGDEAPSTTSPHDD